MTPIEIPLPDDDLEAMRLLCMVLHMKSGCLSRKPTITELRGFAEIVDKYDCTAAVYFVARTWLRDAHEQAATVQDWYNLTESAWLLDEPFAFRRSTKELSLVGQYHRPDQMPQNFEAVVADLVGSQLLKRSEDIITSMLLKIHAPVVAMTENHYQGSLPSRDHGYYQPGGVKYQGGKHDYMVAAAYTAFLNKHGLNRNLSQCSSLADLMLNIENALNSTALAHANVRSYGGCSDVRCRACEIDMRKLFEGLAAEAKSLVDGLCLDCMRNGRARCDVDQFECRRSRYK